MRLTAEESLEQDHENTLSPQHRISPEIWSAIFLYGHHLDSDEDSFDWPARTIWQLSHVCQTSLCLSIRAGRLLLLHSHYYGKPLKWM